MFRQQDVTFASIVKRQFHHSINVKSLKPGVRNLIYLKMIIRNRYFYVYILTNKIKTVLYTGITNNLNRRLLEHYLLRRKKKSFTGKYHCHFLLHYEEFLYATDAIQREKQIKDLSRARKEALIESENPDWRFLNYELFDEWPPKDIQIKE